MNVSMKRIFAAASLAGLLIATGALAREQVYKPHSNVNDPNLVLQLRQEMSRLENGFVTIEEHYTAAGVDFDAIKKAVSEMDAARRTIGRIVPQSAWKEPLNDLNSQLEKVRKAASRQDPITMRKAIDGMYDSCFRCHAANAPKYN